LLHDSKYVGILAAKILNCGCDPWYCREFQSNAAMASIEVVLGKQKILTVQVDLYI
jgi:hypothetical protein